MSTKQRATIRTVLFDLDGTLADTAPDLAYALNCLLQEQNKTPLPFREIRPHVSHGATALVRLGFGFEPSDARFEPLRQRFLEIYQQHLCKHTAVFSGMDYVLDTLAARGMTWGVVTNKPKALTEPLMQQLGLSARSVCIVSGDTLDKKKPHPEPILYACRSAGNEAHECVYVGDAERDIVAGNSAGMHTLVALFGYIGAEDQPDTWGADAMLEKPEDILSWLDQFHAQLEKTPDG